MAIDQKRRVEGLQPSGSALLRTSTIDCEFLIKVTNSAKGASEVLLYTIVTFAELPTRGTPGEALDSLSLPPWYRLIPSNLMETFGLDTRMGNFC